MMTLRNKKPIFILMTLLLACILFITALPVRADFASESKKIAVGGYATIDPAVLPTFDFQYTLKMEPAATYWLKRIHDTKFDDRLFLQRITLSGIYAQNLEKVCAYTSATSTTCIEIPFSSGGTIEIGNIESAAEQRLNDQINYYNTNGTNPPATNFRQYARVEFIFRDTGTGTNAGRGFQITTANATGDIKLHFKLLNPYSTTIPANDTGSAACTTNPNTTTQKRILCNYATFSGFTNVGYSQTGLVSANAYLNVPTQEYRYDRTSDAVTVAPGSSGAVSFKLDFNKMISTAQYDTMKFTAILPAGFQYTGASVTNAAVMAKMQTPVVSTIAGGATRVDLSFDTFPQSIVSPTQQGTFNFVINFVPTASAVSGQDAYGYLRLNNYDAIDGTTGNYLLKKNGTLIATSIGMVGLDTHNVTGVNNSRIFKDAIKINLDTSASFLIESYFGTGYDRLVNVANGENYNYRISLRSPSATLANNATVYEALPQASGGRFRPMMTGPITNPNASRYTIWYCTEPNRPTDPVAGAADGACAWQSNVTDWSTVTAYRIKLNYGSTIPQTADQFTVPMVAVGRGYEQAQHTIWSSNDSGLTFTKTGSSPLTAAMKVRVRVSYDWTKPSATNPPDPSTDVTVTGTPASLVNLGGVSPISLTPPTPANPGTDEKMVDLPAYGIQAGILIPISYKLKGTDNPGGYGYTGPTDVGVCTFDSTTAKNALNATYDFDCGQLYEYPSGTKWEMKAVKNWDANVTTGRTGMVLELHYRVTGSGADFTAVPINMLQVGGLTQNPIPVSGGSGDGDGNDNQESYKWVVPAGPNPTSTYEYRLVERIDPAGPWTLRWHPEAPVTEVVEAGVIIGFAANFTMETLPGNPSVTTGGTATLTNIFDPEMYTATDPLTATVEWENGPVDAQNNKPESYLTLKRYEITNGAACVQSTNEEIVSDSGGTQIILPINAVSDGTWTDYAPGSGGFGKRKTFALSGIPKTDGYGCPYTYWIEETDASGVAMTPAGYEKEDGKTPGADPLRIVNTYIIEYQIITGTKTWAQGTALPRPNTTLGLYLVLSNMGTMTLVVPEHTLNANRMPTDIYHDTCVPGDTNAYQTAGTVVVDDGSVLNNQQTVRWCVPKTDLLGDSLQYYFDEELGNSFTDAAAPMGAVAGPSGLKTSLNAPANYNKSYNYTAGDTTMEIVNTYTSPLIQLGTNPAGQVSATVEWVGGSVSDRGDVELTLKRRWQMSATSDCSVTGVCGSVETIGTEALSATGAGSHTWTVTWNNQVATDADGHTYYYWVEGGTVPANYDDVTTKMTAPPTTTPLVVKYKFRSPHVEVTANKVWVGGDANNRPTVKFTLKRSKDGTTFTNVPANELFAATGQTYATTQPATVDPATWEVRWLTNKQDASDGTLYTFQVVEETLTAYTGVSAPEPGNPLAFTVTNTYQPAQGVVTVAKAWNGGKDPRPSVDVTLQRSTDGATWEDVPGGDLSNPAGQSHVTTNPATMSAAPWTLSWYTYTETDDAVPYQFQVVESTVANYTGAVAPDPNNAKHFNITNTYVSPKVDRVGTKAWSGGSTLTRPAVKLILQRKLASEVNWTDVPTADMDAPDGTYTTDNPVTVNEALSWSAKWHVSENDTAGNVYEFRVEEETTPAGYTKSLDPATLTVTNTYTVPPNIDVVGKIDWIGGTSVLPASVTLQLHRVTIDASGVDVGTPELISGSDVAVDAASFWKHTWSVEPNEQATGLRYRYWVDETAVPTDFTKVESRANQTPITDNNSLTVTNKYNAPAGTYIGSKIWDGGPESKRGDITITLYRKPQGGTGQEAVTTDQGGNPITNPVLLAANTAATHNWQVTWTNLAVNNPTGTPYEYWIEESAAPANFTEVVDSDPMTVTNKYVQPLYNGDGNVTGNVEWIGGAALLNGITVDLQLYRQKLDAGGSPIGTSETVGAPVALVGANASTHNWKHTWTGMFASDPTTGETYKYWVDELSVPTDFKKVYSTTNQTEIVTNTTLTVTNKYQAPAGTVTANKVWQGGSVAEHCDIKIRLFRNNSLVLYDVGMNPIPNPVELKVADAATHQWQYSWQNLIPEDASNVYSVTEEFVTTGCKYVEDTNDGLPLTITNVYNAPPINVTGTKRWVNGQLFREPVELTLYRAMASDPAGTVGTAVLASELLTGANCAAANPMTLTPTGTTAAGADTEEQSETWCVPSTDNTGNAYRYSIQESWPVGTLHQARWTTTYEGDAMSAAGATVVNTFVPETQTVTVSKRWVRAIGATSVTFTLTQTPATGTPVDTTVTLTDADATVGDPKLWTKDVTVPVTDAKGQPYTNSVDENAVGTCTKTIDPANTNTSLTIANDCNYKPGKLKVVVEWVGGPTTKPTVQLEVKDNHNQVTSVTLPGAGGIYEITLDLPVADANDVYLTYSLTQITDLSADYTTTYGTPATVQLDYYDNVYELKVINTYKQATGSVTAEKKWMGGDTLQRPTIWFKLYRKVQGSIDAPVAVPDTEAGLKTLNHGTTTVTWTGVNTVDPNGAPYEFSVKEVDSTGTDETFVPDSYTKVENGLTVTNTYHSSGSVTATKVWQSGTDPHPTIWFKLFRQLPNGAVEEVPTAQAPIVELQNGVTDATWNNVELTDATGVPYKFTVKEVDATGADWTPAGYGKVEKDLTVINAKQGLLTVAINTTPASATVFNVVVSNVNGDMHTEQIDSDVADTTVPSLMIVTDIPTVAHTIKIDQLDLEAWEVTAINCTQQPLGSTDPATITPLPIMPAFDYNGKMTGEFTIDTVPDQATLACVYDLRSRIGGKVIVTNETYANPANPLYPAYHYQVTGPGYTDFDLAANPAIPDSQEVQPSIYTVAQHNVVGWVTLDVIVKSSIPGRRPLISLNEERIAQLDGMKVRAQTTTLTGWKSVAKFSLEPNETVWVTFINAPANTVMIRKETIPAGSRAKFEFRGVISGEIGDGEYLLAANMTPTGEIWQVTEQSKDNWDLVEVNCIERGVIGTTPTHGDRGTASAYIGLDDGESILCTFVNRDVTETLPEEHYDPPVPGFTDFALPKTGFAPDTVTNLPEQPANKLYQASTLTLNIPGLGQSMNIAGIPLVDGQWDVTWLGVQAGYLEGSAFPTHQGNSVITAHVWDAYNNPGPFFGLKNLRYGDRFTIDAYGKTYVYEIRESERLLATAVDQMMDSRDGSWVTLMTCEAYDEGEDKYTYRRLVRAVLVEVY